MKCKNCNEKPAIKYSKYSNGEFCSRTCARSFSTKNEIKKLKKAYCFSCGKIIDVNKRTNIKKIKCEDCRPKPKTRHSGKREIRICKNCQIEFSVLSIKVRIGGGIFCSRKCHFEFLKDNRRNEKQKKYDSILYQKKFRYKLSKSEYLKLMEIDKCMICNDQMDSKCIDHNHQNNNIRGIICNKCNRALGFFKDSIEILRNAIEYIENDGTVVKNIIKKMVP